MASIGRGFQITGAVAAMGYTAPANGYAIVNICLFNGGTTATARMFRFNLGSSAFDAWCLDPKQSVATSSGPAPMVFQGLYLGPGQSVSASILSGTVGDYSINGVEFTNT